MDPKANLLRQRELAQAIIDATDKGRSSEVEDMAIELAELVQALDEWMTRGGFSPWGASELPRALHDEMAPPDPSISAYHNPPERR